jgi:hypothetical protein
LHRIKLVQNPRTHHDQYIVDILGRTRLANKVHDNELKVWRIICLNMVQCWRKCMNSRCRPATERDQQFAKVEEIVLLLKSEELVFARRGDVERAYLHGRRYYWQCYRASTHQRWNNSSTSPYRQTDQPLFAKPISNDHLPIPACQQNLCRFHRTTS